MANQKFTMAARVFIFTILGAASCAYAAAGLVLNFSDLINGPKSGLNDGLGEGAIVTVWGNNLGSSQGTSKLYFKDSQNNTHEAAHIYYWKNADGQLPGGPAELCTYHKMQEIAFSIPSAAADGPGSIYVKVNGTDSNELEFTINNGRIFFATNADVRYAGSGSFADPFQHITDFYQQLLPGDLLYSRGGVYTGSYGFWQAGAGQFMLAKTGQINKDNVFACYPGERVTVQGPGRAFRLGTPSDGKAHHTTISKYCMDGNATSGAGGVSGDGFYASEETGASDARIVGCKIYNCMKSSSTNTMTGTVVFNADNNSILGSEINNVGVSSHPINNHHLVYVQSGSDNAEIAYNYFHDDAVGHCVQIHGDNPGKFQYDNVRIHSNYISGRHRPADIRGPTISNVLTDTTVYFYNNIIDSIGEFSGINIVNGNVHVYNNTFYNMQQPAISLYSSYAKQVYASNNIMYVSPGRQYILFGTYATDYPDWSNIALENNLYYGNGDGPSQDAKAINSNPLFADEGGLNLYLQETSPARDAGTSSVSGVLTKDYYGFSRPQGAAYDIGAFEYTDGTTAPPDTTPPAAPGGITVE